MNSDRIHPAFHRQTRESNVCFYISGFTLLTVYLYFVFFYLAAFKRHYALRLAIAPEFFYCSYMCLFYVCALGCFNKICMYVCMSLQLAFKHVSSVGYCAVSVYRQAKRSVPFCSLRAYYNCDTSTIRVRFERDTTSYEELCAFEQ